MHKVKLLIVGAGAAGMAAALAAETELQDQKDQILLVERDAALGGVLKQCIHQGFGLSYFRQNMTGVEYMQAFLKKVDQSSVRILCDTSVQKITAQKTAILCGPQIGCMEISFEHLILSTGCYERPFASLGIAGTRPSGIFTAGEAQRLVNICHKNIGEQIVILGSGDMGQILARRLSIQGKNVITMIEQRPTCGGNKKNQHDCLETYHIPVLLSSTITYIHGIDRITGVTVQDLTTGQETHISCDTLISAVGLIPERSLIRHLEQNGQYPDWITLCGNCEHVHTIVDHATMQGENAGKEIAKKLL